MRFVPLSMAGLLISAGAVVAEPVVGTWLTGPDHKGQVAHIEVRACGGGAVCGTIIQAFDKNGDTVVTPNVGKRVFWDMTRQDGPGAYFGKAYVPKYKATVNAGMTLSGNRLKVKGCAGPVCKSQTWTRVN